VTYLLAPALECSKNQDSGSCWTCFLLACVVQRERSSLCWKTPCLLWMRFFLSLQKSFNPGFLNNKDSSIYHFDSFWA
jgi:hypothetical protein